LKKIIEFILNKQTLSNECIDFEQNNSNLINQKLLKKKKLFLVYFIILSILLFYLFYYFIYLTYLSHQKENK
jgi:hypothetical protein